MMMMYESYNHYPQQMDHYPQRMNGNMNRPMEGPPKQMFRPQQPAYNQPPMEMDYHRSNAPAVHPVPSPANSIFPRSASEALFDTTSKFRQLPCRTFISVGTCPYRERCVYLHDPRCICKEAKTKTRRKNKEDVVLDALFWPVMPYSMVAAKLDMNRQPHVIQSYSVPLPQPDQYRKHDTAVYSMWMHFVDFCLANSESSGLRDADASPCFSAPDKPYNSYTEEQRLKFFQFLSSCNGRPVSRDELIRATSTGVQIPARHQAFFDAAPAVPVRRPSVPLSHSMSGTMEEPLNPYFSSSEAPLDSVYDPAAGRAYGQSQMGPAGPGRSAGAFPPASPHHPLHSVPERDVYAQPAPYMNANMSNMSGNVGIGGGMGDREKAIRRASRTSSQSASPVTVTACERSPHRAPGSLAAQAQQRVAIGASLGTIGPKHGFQAAQEDLPPIPTSLSLLMNTVPQNSLAGVFPKVDLMSQHDPWADMALAVTDDERDSGSSANSEALQDFRSLWKSDTTFSSSCGDASLFSASHYQTSIESIFSM